MEDVVVVLVTAPRGRGAEIARKLLEERLVACVNIAQVRSLYWWRGSIEEDDEDLLVMKTSRKLVSRLVERIREIHPYEVPEVLVIPVEAGLRDYIEWVKKETSQ